MWNVLPAIALKSCYLSLKSTFAGVQQRYVLGPLFLVLTTRLFADDSSLFYAVVIIADIAGRIINHDLQMLSNWAKQW